MVITNDNFESVMNSGKPVVLDFWATWCGPCRIMGPVIEELAKEYEGKVVVGKVDVDNEPDLAQRFNVMSIPTMLLFKDGKIMATHIGVTPKSTLTALLDSSI